jgi:hypothetical protein
MSKLSMSHMQKMLSASANFHGKNWANIADETVPYKPTHSPPKSSINALEAELKKRKAAQEVIEEKAKKAKEVTKSMRKAAYNKARATIKKFRLTNNAAARVKEEGKRHTLNARNMTRKLREDKAAARKATQNAQNALNKAIHMKKVENIKAAAAKGNKAAREAKEAARKEAHKQKVAATRAAAATRRAV